MTTIDVSFLPTLQNCRPMIQGITGREASMVAEHMLAYGTNLVAGVSPGKGGQKVKSIPVYDSVDEAIVRSKPNISIVYVPPANARDAVLEAIDGDIELILVVTERVPRQDTIELIARANNKCRIIGPNITGLIYPSWKVKLGPIGGQEPDRTFIPGTVAIISRSGGMTSEIAWTLKTAGFGTSIGMSIGGDPIVGTTMLEAMTLIEHDSNTQCVVLFGEPGGLMENEVAEYVLPRGFGKPVVALVAGRFTELLPRGVKFGHAGALIRSDEELPSSKIEAFRKSGVSVAESLSEIPRLVDEAIKKMRL